MIVKGSSKTDKTSVEKSIKKSYENKNTIDNNTEKTFPIVSVDINPETKSLDIIFYDNIKKAERSIALFLELNCAATLIIDLRFYKDLFSSSSMEIVW